MEEQSTSENMGKAKTVLMVFLMIVFFALGAGATVYVARTMPQYLGLPKNDQQVKAEVEDLVAEVGKLIALPTDETPTVATVSDAEKVRGQSFFRNAENGDKVLIYTNAKRAILYRPTEKKVVEVGSVNINQQTNTGTAVPETASTPSATVVPTAIPTFPVE